MVKRTIIAAVFVLVTMLIPIARLSAACSPGAGGNILGFPTWYQYLEGEDIGGKCTPVIDFTNPSNITAIVLAIIEIMLRIAALVAVVFVIVGGFKLILGQGNPDSAASARKTIINSLIGLLIALLATGIVSLVARTLS